MRKKSEKKLKLKLKLKIKFQKNRNFFLSPKIFSKAEIFCWRWSVHRSLGFDVLASKGLIFTEIGYK